MTMTEARVAELTNGYERRTDGLWLHRGKADIGTARITNNLPPNNGQGLELVHVPGAGGYGIVQAYDRDAGAYRDLVLGGTNVSLQLHGGTLNLPAGSVGTSAIAANSVQQLIGQYVSTPSFSTTATTPVPTPVTVSFTTGGGTLRIECTTATLHSAVGAPWYLGLGFDGAPPGLYLALLYQPTANFVHPTALIQYTTLAAGAHSVTLWVSSASAGTLSLSALTTHVLYVTEQKR